MIELQNDRVNMIDKINNELDELKYGSKITELMAELIPPITPFYSCITTLGIIQELRKMLSLVSPEPGALDNSLDWLWVFRAINQVKITAYWCYGFDFYEFENKYNSLCLDMSIAYAGWGGVNPYYQKYL